MLSFANASAAPMTAGRFSTSVAAVIGDTAIAVMVAVRRPAASSAAQRIANTNKLPMVEMTIAIISGTTAIASFKPT